MVHSWQKSESSNPGLSGMRTANSNPKMDRLVFDGRFGGALLVCGLAAVGRRSAVDQKMGGNAQRDSKHEPSVHVGHVLALSVIHI